MRGAYRAAHRSGPIAPNLCIPECVDIRVFIHIFRCGFQRNTFRYWCGQTNSSIVCTLFEHNSHLINCLRSIRCGGCGRPTSLRARAIKWARERGIYGPRRTENGVSACMFCWGCGVWWVALCLCGDREWHGLYFTMNIYAHTNANESQSCLLYSSYTCLFRGCGCRQPTFGADAARARQQTSLHTKAHPHSRPRACHTCVVVVVAIEWHAQRTPLGIQVARSLLVYMCFFFRVVHSRIFSHSRRRIWRNTHTMPMWRRGAIFFLVLSVGARKQLWIVFCAVYEELPQRLAARFFACHLVLRTPYSAALWIHICAKHTIYNARYTKCHSNSWLYINLKKKNYAPQTEII